MKNNVTRQNHHETSNRIPENVALKLCEEIYDENKRKKVGIWKVQCHFCRTTAKDDQREFCIFANGMNRGCPQVNRRYDLV